MRSKISLFICSVGLAGCINSEGTNENLGRHSSYFRDKEQYEFYFKNIDAEKIRTPIRGAILPHHLLVGEYLAQAYTAMSNSKPSVIVLLGPDHFGSSHSPAITTDLDFNTPYGPIQLEQNVLRRLTNEGVVFIEQSPFWREHSISSHTALIKKIFPTSRIVPIILRRSQELSVSQNLGKKLAMLLPPDALVIASVDFVHYMPEYVSAFHDDIAISALRSFDESQVHKIDTDCAACLVTLATFLRERGATSVVYEQRTSVAELISQPETVDNTSHLYMLFADGDIEKSPAVSMIFFGDAIFSRGIQEQSEYSYRWLNDISSWLSPLLRSVDIAGFNLEGPVTSRPCTTQSRICLRQDDHLLWTFFRKFYSFNTVLFANNHTFDSGIDGAKETAEFLALTGKATVGFPEACSTMHASDKRISVCAFDDSWANIDEKAMIGAIRSTSGSDLTVVSMHWGIDYQRQQTERQQSLAHALVDAGADAVIGHHPHAVQPFEIYKDSPILYSLGNFLFDENDEKRSEGLAVGLLFLPEETRLFLYPLSTVHGQPKLLKGDERRKALQALFQSEDTKDYVVMPRR